MNLSVYSVYCTCLDCRMCLFDMRGENSKLLFGITACQLDFSDIMIVVRSCSSNTIFGR